MGVPPSSSNPDPISDPQKTFFMLIFRPGIHFSKVLVTFWAQNQNNIETEIKRIRAQSWLAKLLKPRSLKLMATAYQARK